MSFLPENPMRRTVTSLIAAAPQIISRYRPRTPRPLPDKCAPLADARCAPDAEPQNPVLPGVPCRQIPDINKF